MPNSIPPFHPFLRHRRQALGVDAASLSAVLDPVYLLLVSIAGEAPQGLVGIEEASDLINHREERMPEEEASDQAAAPSESTDPAGKSSDAAGKSLAEMLPLVYEELRRLAAGYLRLAGQPDLSWENPAHLLGIFARLMRQTLINHAVARTRAKRGGDNPTDVILEFYERHQIDVAAVDEALRELETLDPRQAKIVELRFFGGLTIEEIAKLLEISPATVKREWTVAKLWLRHALEDK
jgi:RNA polymerase sigma factor (sigma-70 family)